MTQRVFIAMFAALIGGTDLVGTKAARAETDDLLTGTNLVIKPGNQAKLSGKGTLDLPDAANAPNVSGGTLVIFDAGGTARDAYHLPAKGWKGLGKPAGTMGWQYKGKASDDNPCTAVKVTPKAVTATCKKSGVTLAPPFVGPVAAVLSIGGGRKQYCASFGGTVKKNDATQFKATKAPAPTACGLAQPTWDLGEQKTLLPSGALGGLCYFPDEATVRVPGITQFRLLTWGAKCLTGGLIIPDLDTAGTYLFEGSDIEHLQSARLVLGRGDPGEFDNGYAGICGLHRHSDGRLYGFYHAEDQEGLPVIPGSGFIPGYYASVGAAVSDDDGQSWQKLGRIITSNKPKEWTYYPGQAARGASVMSAVADPTGRYLHAYWSEQSGVNATDTFVGEQIAMARASLTAGPPLPGQWWKYFGGEFIQPGIGGQNDIVLSVWDSSPAHATQPHVTYSAHLRRYLMIVGAIDFEEYQNAADAERSGMYIAFSADGVTWSARQPLINEWPAALVGKSVSWEANVLWDDDSGQKGWLVYGYSPKWGTIGHYMVGRRIEFH